MPPEITPIIEEPALIVTNSETSLVVADIHLGIVTSLVKSHLMHSHLIYLESNHDPQMLMSGPYPWHLKQRIKGRTGHLSNADAVQLVSELMHDQLEHVILAHLSEENNCPSIAGDLMRDRLNGSKVRVHIAGPDKPGDLIEL